MEALHTGSEGGKGRREGPTGRGEEEPPGKVWRGRTLVRDYREGRGQQADDDETPHRTGGRSRYQDAELQPTRWGEAISNM